MTVTTENNCRYSLHRFADKIINAPAVISSDELHYSAAIYHVS